MASFFTSLLQLFASFLLLNTAVWLHISTFIASSMAVVLFPLPLVPSILSWIAIAFRCLTQWIVSEACLQIRSVRASVLRRGSAVSASPAAPSTHIVYALAEAYVSLLCTYLLLLLAILFRPFTVLLTNDDGAEILILPRGVMITAATRPATAGKFRCLISYLASIYYNEMRTEQYASQTDKQEMSIQESIPHEEPQQIVCTEVALTHQDETETEQYASRSDMLETSTEEPLMVIEQNSTAVSDQEALVPDALLAMEEVVSTSNSRVQNEKDAAVRSKRKAKRVVSRDVTKPGRNPSSSEPAQTYWGKPGGFRYVELPAKKKRNNKARK